MLLRLLITWFNVSNGMLLTQCDSWFFLVSGFIFWSIFSSSSNVASSWFLFSLSHYHSPPFLLLAMFHAYYYHASICYYLMIDFSYFHDLLPSLVWSTAYFLASFADFYCSCDCVFSCLFSSTSLFVCYSSNSGIVGLNSDALWEILLWANSSNSSFINIYYRKGLFIQ